MSAFYIVAYASLSLPAILAGVLETPVGLTTTFEIFGMATAALALLVAAQAWRTRPKAEPVALADERWFSEHEGPQRCAKPWSRHVEHGSPATVILPFGGKAAPATGASPGITAAIARRRRPSTRSHHGRDDRRRRRVGAIPGKSFRYIRPGHPLGLSFLTSAGLLVPARRAILAR